MATKLGASKLRAAEFSRTVYAVVVPLDVTPEAVLEPEFWAHVAKDLKPYDRVEVIPDDGTWFSELIVVSATAIDAFVVELQHTHFSDHLVGRETTAKFVVNWGGPVNKYRVVRVSDGAMVHKGCLDKEEANLWLADYERALGR
jgi:hypothetical protein